MAHGLQQSKKDAFSACIKMSPGRLLKNIDWFKEAAAGATWSLFFIYQILGNSIGLVSLYAGNSGLASVNTLAL
jgi:hypothetical protein